MLNALNRVREIDRDEEGNQTVETIMIVALAAAALALIYKLFLTEGGSFSITKMLGGIIETFGGFFTKLIK